MLPTSSPNENCPETSDTVVPRTPWDSRSLRGARKTPFGAAHVRVLATRVCTDALC